MVCHKSNCTQSFKYNIKKKKKKKRKKRKKKKKKKRQMFTKNKFVTQMVSGFCHFRKL